MYWALYRQYRLTHLDLYIIYMFTMIGVLTTFYMIDVKYANEQIYPIRKLKVRVYFLNMNCIFLL
jgi:hypothetical protein